MTIAQNRTQFDPFRLLSWLTGVRWTDGNTVLECTTFIAPDEHRLSPADATELVVDALQWLYDQQFIGWLTFREDVPGPLTRDDVAQISRIWVTPAGYDIMTAHGSDHLSGVVAPIIVAFSIPTVAVILTTGQWAVQPSDSMRLILAVLFVVSGGLLLASFQLSVGTVRRVATHSVRSVLSYLGIIFLWAGMVTFLVPLLPRAGGVIEVASIVLVALVTLGVVIPIWLRIREWNRHRAARTWSSTRS